MLNPELHVTVAVSPRDVSSDEYSTEPLRTAGGSEQLITVTVMFEKYVYEQFGFVNGGETLTDNWNVVSDIGKRVLLTSLFS